MISDFDVHVIDAAIRFLVAAVREMLDFRSDFPLVVEDIADADVVAELEVGRQAVIIVIVQF